MSITWRKHTHLMVSVNDGQCNQNYKYIEHKTLCIASYSSHEDVDLLATKQWLTALQ